MKRITLCCLLSIALFAVIASDPVDTRCGETIRLAGECTDCEECGSGWWSRIRCCWERNGKRHKPVQTCYPAVMPLHGPFYGYHETCWRRLPPQYRCLRPNLDVQAGWERGGESGGEEGNQPRLPEPAYPETPLDGTDATPPAPTEEEPSPLEGGGFEFE